MKKIITLCVALIATYSFAQDKNFEGIIVQKALLSYSEEILRAADHYTPGRDTIITYIKDDLVHSYTKGIGFHMLYANGNIYCYCDHIHEGFSMPERSVPNTEALKETIETNEQRSMLGHQCAVKKYFLLSNNQTVENTSWVTDNVYNLSDKAMKIVFPDTEGQMCLKSNLCTYTTGNSDASVKLAKSFASKEQRELAWGSIKKEAAEVSTSKISEVIEIKEMPLDDSFFKPGADVTIKHYTMADIVKEPPFDADMFKKLYLATPGLSKAAKKDNVVNAAMEGQAKIQRDALRKMCSDANYKTKGIVPRDLAKAEKKSVEDIHQMNLNFEDAMYWIVLPIKINQILRKNNAYLKEHKLYTEENIKPVAYDLDEEWDF